LAAVGTGAVSTIRPAASAVQTDNGPVTQTFNTPFGPVTLTGSATAPPLGTSGAVAVSVSANTPIGNAAFSLSGSVSYSPGLNQVTVSNGVAVLPSSIAFLADAFSPSIAGALSLVNSAATFFTALQHGNIAQAAQTFFSAPFTFTNAMLFGHETITLPLSLQPGTTVVLSIPFGGTFASLITPTLTIPSYSYVDESNQITYQVNGTSISLTGTQFSGIVPAFLKVIGL
jgi:hypothetical protein